MTQSAANPGSAAKLIAVEQPKQLLVEGRSTWEFFAALLRNIQISDIQLQDFGGINELRKFLKAFRALPGFQERVVSIGIVRDVERDAQAPRLSACQRLFEKFINQANAMLYKYDQKLYPNVGQTSILVFTRLITSSVNSVVVE